MNTAYPLHPHADAPHAQAHAALDSGSASAETGLQRAVMPDTARPGPAQLQARNSATAHRTAEIAALFALAALAVTRASAAPDTHAAPLYKAVLKTWGMLTPQPAITTLPLPLPVSIRSGPVQEPTRGIVVRHSTRLTRPSLRQMAGSNDTIVSQLAQMSKARQPMPVPSAQVSLAGLFDGPRSIGAQAVPTRGTLPVKMLAQRELPETMWAHLLTIARPGAKAVSSRQPALASLPPLRAASQRTPFVAPQDGTVRILRSAKEFDLSWSSLPAATATPGQMPQTQPLSFGLNGALPSEIGAEKLPPMGKVISVASLKLPPVAEPLPKWSADKVVPADAPRVSPAVPAKGKPADGRIAQNPTSPPLPQPSAPITNSDRLPNQLEVSVGTFVVLLTTSDLNTVAVADPNTADVAVVSSRAVLVNGKTPGVTSLVIVDHNRIRQYQVRVTPAIGTRPPDVASAIGLPGVSVRPLRDALVLEGEVENAEEVRRAVEIAGIFSPKVINQLTVRGTPTDAAAISTQIQSAINLPNVTVRTIGDTMLLEGTVENSAQLQRAQTIASHLSKNVLNLIETPRLTVDQVRDALGGQATLPPPDAISGQPTPGFTVRQVGDQIILEGMAATQPFIDQAVATAARTGLQVVNRLLVMPAMSESNALLGSIASAINIPGVHVAGSAKRLVLLGTVADTNAAVMAEQIARSFATEVDNMLQTPNPITVNVDVAIVEIDRNDLKNLGATWTNFLDGAANPVGFVLSEPTATGAPGLVTDNAGGLRTRSPLQASIRAVVDNGRARLLSNPRTTVLSGRTATFQVGGQVPIPGQTTITNAGATTLITFKDFGILIDIVPQANLNGVVTMRVRTEVSQPDFTLGVTPPGGGSAIPGFVRRSAVTEVTVPRNGTVALAGLMQNNSRALIRKVPLLSKLPILGALFTSKRFQNDETELAIFVTPTVLPNPLAPGQTAPAAPVAVGNTTNAGTVMGNPGIAVFNTGSAFTGGATAAPSVGGQ